MRRGTPAAIEFGKMLEDIRVKLQVSMRKLGAQLGVPAATVSQIERGERALKEPRISAWAEAYQVEEDWLRGMWIAIQLENPDPPIIRPRSASVQPKELEDLLKLLTSHQRSRVLGYIEALLREEV